MKKVDKTFHIHVGMDSTGEELVEALEAACGILGELSYMLACIAHHVEDEESSEALTDAAARVTRAKIDVAGVAIDLAFSEVLCD